MSRAWDHYFSEDFVSSFNSISESEMQSVLGAWNKRGSRTATGIQQMREQAHVGLSRELVKLQRIQNDITNSILDMLWTPQYVVDELDWKLYLSQHPVRKPKWRN